MADAPHAAALILSKKPPVQEGLVKIRNKDQIIFIKTDFGTRVFLETLKFNLTKI
jgi:hypothetical protein